MLSKNVFLEGGNTRSYKQLFLKEFSKDTFVPNKSWETTVMKDKYAGKYSKTRVTDERILPATFQVHLVNREPPERDVVNNCSYTSPTPIRVIKSDLTNDYCVGQP